MNQVLDEFFVQFTTKGLTEVKDAINDLNKKMDEVGIASEKATQKQNGFFSNIKGWTASILGFTAVVAGLKAAWNGVAEASAKTMDLYWNSLYIGTSAETLERWQRVATRNKLNAGDINPSFNSLYNFLYEYSNGQVPGEEFNKKVGLALQGTTGAAEIQDAIMNSVNSGNANAVLATLNKYISSGLLGSQASQSLLDAFGINNQTMMGLLSQGNLAWQLSQVPIINAKPEVAESSARRERASAILSEEIEKIKTDPQLIDTETRILEQLTTLTPYLEDLAKWAANKTEKIVKGIDETLTNEGDTKAEQTMGGFLKILGGGATLATLEAMGAPALMAIAGAVAAGWGADKLHNYLLQFDWYKNLINSDVAPEGFWQNYDNQYQEMLKGADAGNVQPFFYGMNLPKSESNATAVVNLEGIKVAEKRGNGYTEINMSLDQIPSVAR